MWGEPHLGQTIATPNVLVSSSRSNCSLSTLSTAFPFWCCGERQAELPSMKTTSHEFRKPYSRRRDMTVPIVRTQLRATAKPARRTGRRGSASPGTDASTATVCPPGAKRSKGGIGASRRLARMGAVPEMRECRLRPTSSSAHGASRSERDRQPTEPKAMEGRLTASVSTQPDDRLRPTAGTGGAGGAADRREQGACSRRDRQGAPAPGVERGALAPGAFAPSALGHPPPAHRRH